MNITIIGAGNMGVAIAKCLTRQSADFHITVTSASKDTALAVQKEFPQVNATTDNRSAAHSAEVIVVAVKPWLVDSVLKEIAGELAGKTVISVAAGVRNDLIDVYAMPNIAAEFGQSMTFIEQTDNIEAVEKCISLFQSIGSVQVVAKKQMAAGMMMAGCGIAYVMRFVRAMMEGGVEMGFRPEDSKRIALQTMEGATAFLEATNLHPEEAIDKVTTPGGYTIKGLNELDHAGFTSAVIRALKAGLD